MVGLVFEWDFEGVGRGFEILYAQLQLCPSEIFFLFLGVRVFVFFSIFFFYLFPSHFRWLGFVVHDI